MATTITTSKLTSIDFNSTFLDHMYFNGVHVFPPTKEERLRSSDHNIYVYMGGNLASFYEVKDSFGDTYSTFNGEYSPWTYPLYAYFTTSWNSDYSVYTVKVEIHGTGWSMKSSDTLTHTADEMLAGSVAYNFIADYAYRDIEESTTNFNITVNGNTVETLSVASSLPTEYGSSLGRLTKTFTFTYYHIVTYWDWSTDEYVARLVLEGNDDDTYESEARVSRTTAINSGGTLSLSSTALINKNKNAILSCDDYIKLVMRKPNINGNTHTEIYVPDTLSGGTYTEAPYGTVNWAWDSNYENLIFSGSELQSTVYAPLQEVITRDASFMREFTVNFNSDY